MSRAPDARRIAAHRSQAAVFAALGDDTRLRLVAKLSGGQLQSIARLTAGSKLTRQAVTKHLRVMETVGLVHGARRGREILFRLTPEPIETARQYLDGVSAQWDQALARLKSFVESDPA